MATSVKWDDSEFKEYDLLNFKNYPAELKLYVPYNVIGYLSFLQGTYKLVDMQDDGVFQLIIRESAPSSQSLSQSKTQAQLSTSTGQQPIVYKKENIVLGRLDKQTGKLDGPYYIIKEKDLLNIYMVGSEISNGLLPEEVKQGSMYQDKQTGKWRESGNYKVFFYSPMVLTIDQYQNFKLTVQTEQISAEDYKYKTTRNFTNGVMHYSATYDVFDTPVQITRTYNVSPNPSFSTPFQPSVPDNNTNLAVRNFFGLTQNTPNTSYMSSKIHPLINDVFTGSDNSELVITYTESGIIYSLHIINAKLGSLSLIDKGIVYGDLIDLMQEISNQNAM